MQTYRMHCPQMILVKFGGAWCKTEDVEKLLAEKELEIKRLNSLIEAEEERVWRL